MKISEYEELIREFINQPRKQAGLLKNREAWNILCSALDVIGDTELAIDAYLDKSKIDSHGESYLVVYGALQVLQVQQDAIANLCSALSLALTLPNELDYIRIARNEAVGHPTRHKEKKVIKSSFIVRHSLSGTGFSLMTVFSDGRPYEHRYIDIPKLIDTQRKHLDLVLEKVIEKLRKEELEHRERHMKERLQDNFPDTLGYYFSKIFEAADDPSFFPLGKLHIELIEKCTAEFRQGLEKRGEWGAYSSINYLYELLEYPIKELKIFFSEKGKSKLNSKDVYIFTEFVRNQMKELEDIAKEIDADYASKP